MDISQLFKTRDGFLTTLNSYEGVIIMWFTASWCGPCRRISNIVRHSFDELNKNGLAKCVILDVDEYSDLYSFLKTKKMVNGIPAILCYMCSCKSEKVPSYIPDASVTGGDEARVAAFFNMVKLRLNNMK